MKLLRKIREKNSYLSSATEGLCVTTAIPVSARPDTFVIAVDANLKGLIRAAQ